MTDPNTPRPTKHKLLFLALDGVVHPAPEGALPRSWDTGVLPLLGIRFFLARPMRRLITLCEERDIGIVLSSSWRLAGFSREEFNQVFKGLVVGLTPDLSGKSFNGPLREREVQAYLETLDEGVAYATVDSRREGYSAAWPNLFLAEPRGLFSDELATAIGRVLG